MSNFFLSLCFVIAYLLDIVKSVFRGKNQSTSNFEIYEQKMLIFCCLLVCLAFTPYFVYKLIFSQIDQQKKGHIFSSIKLTACINIQWFCNRESKDPECFVILSLTAYPRF